MHSLHDLNQAGAQALLNLRSSLFAFSLECRLTQTPASKARERKGQSSRGHVYVIQVTLYKIQRVLVDCR